MKTFERIIAAGAAAIALTGIGSAAIAFNNNAAPAATHIQLVGSIQGASNPPPGIRPGQCWHPGHGIGGGRAATQWINSWIVPCGSPGARGPV